MSRRISLPDPKRFDLASFADLLPDREPIIGEDPGSYDGFHEGVMQVLAPTTPYESVIAENLIAIEWELLQQRRMREADLRRLIRNEICSAVIAEAKATVEEELREARRAHYANGGDGDNWYPPFEFDEEAAESDGEAIAERAMSGDRTEQAAAYAEIAELGMKPVELMAEAYRTLGRSDNDYDRKMHDLERRRREVRRDYDALVNARPVDAEVIEG